MVIATAEIDQISRVNALTDRVRKRKEEWFDARPHVDAERARLVTESWKETEDEPTVIRRAKLFKKIMEGISVTIREGELIVGYQSRYIRGASPAIDFNSTYGPQLFASEHLTLSGEVKTGEISEAEKASILEDSAYWKGRAPGDVIARMTKEVFGSKIDDLLSARIAVSPCPHYAMPDYGKVIDVGLNGIIAEAKEHIQKLLSSDLSDESSIDRYHFLEAVVISCQGAINFARRYARLARKMAIQEANETRKKELEMIAETCERVPADPARGFHEALQSAWFIALAGNLECGYMGSIPGRMDQYLYPLYQKDMDEGRLTRQEAAELVGCYWVKLCEMEHIRPTERKQIGQGNQILDVTLGGLTREGRDATNELTYLILEVAHQFKTPQPSVFLRVHNETPQALWMKAVEVNRDRGDGQPAFMNDEAVLLNQTGLGVSLEDARDYQATGCLHPLPSHAAGFNQIKFFNMAKVLELALNNGVDPQSGKQIGPRTGDPKTFSTFDEMYGALKKQVGYFVDLLGRDYRLAGMIRAKAYPHPFNSALTDDCIARGKDVAEGGCRYPQWLYKYLDRGHVNIADSLTAIRKLVFEDKKITMDRLLRALKANFEGKENEEVRRLCLAAPKYGNDDDYADELFDDFWLWSGRRIQVDQENNPYGVKMACGRGGATFHYYYGGNIGALPDGRKAGTPLADGCLSPMQGRDLKGPTAVISSASKIRHTQGVVTDGLFNMKFSRGLMQSRDNLQKLVALIKTYNQRGGFHVQFNIQGAETLREAQKHPDEYRDLVVRIAGYSAYFVELVPEVQNEIIARTEHAL